MYEKLLLAVDAFNHFRFNFLFPIFPKIAEPINAAADTRWYGPSQLRVCFGFRFDQKRTASILLRLLKLTPCRFTF